MGILTRLVEKPDLWNYKPEFYPNGTEKHIFLDGARFHVLSYSTKGTHCSEPKCEYNLPPDDMIALWVDAAVIAHESSEKPSRFAQILSAELARSSKKGTPT